MKTNTIKVGQEYNLKLRNASIRGEGVVVVKDLFTSLTSNGAVVYARVQPTDGGRAFSVEVSELQQ